MAACLSTFDQKPAPNATIHGVLYRLTRIQYVRLDATDRRQDDYFWTATEYTTGNRLPMVTYKVSQKGPKSGRAPLAERNPRSGSATGASGGLGRIS
jgi:hypothetical protein